MRRSETRRLTNRSLSHGRASSSCLRVTGKEATSTTVNHGSLYVVDINLHSV
jgi:hypothetical protein